MKILNPLLILFVSLLLAGCPDEGALCPTGQLHCGEELQCTDVQSDTANCGACGNSCAPGQVCSEGQCECGPGAVLCGSVCSVQANDPANCGACGNACPTGQVCQAGTCTLQCEAGLTQCGQSCVDLQQDPANCGACGASCSNATTCHDGVCAYDIVGACSTNGQLVGVQAGSDLLGPTRAVGTRPHALASLRDLVLVPDDDQTMSQVRTSDLATVGERSTVGGDSRFILSADPFVYVVNSTTGTVQIFEAGGPSDGGVLLTQRAELPLSEGDKGNTYAQGVVKHGNTLYIPLAGGYFSEAAENEGQKVVKVDVTHPSAPALAGVIDLTTLDLRAFDGGRTLPRPAEAIIHRGALYVALNNQDAFGFSPGGPPLLAKMNLETGELTTVDVGSDVCLAPTNLESDGERLYVSCFGQSEFDATFSLVKVEKSGVAILNPDDSRLSAWAPGVCPEGQAGCVPALTGRFAVRGSDIYVGDNNGGRLFVLELGADGGITERRGFNAPAAPLQACPIAENRSFSNLADVISLP